jgi:hypothetical protein
MAEEITYVYPSEIPEYCTNRGSQGEGFLEYKVRTFKIFLPIFQDYDDAKELWGENCTPEWLNAKVTRGIGNDWDNKVPAMIADWEKEGLSEQEMADKLQAYVEQYEVAKPRASASAETKRKAAIVKEAENAGLTDAEIREALKALAEKKAAEA